MVFIVAIVKWINQQTSAQICGPDYGVTEWLLFLLQADHDLRRNKHPGFGFVENLGILPLVQNHFNGDMMIFASD